MVLPDTQQILNEKEHTIQKTQNHQKVFNLVMENKREFALVQIVVLQLVNLNYCGNIHYRQLSHF